jgi:hypothetical protein
MDFATWRHWLFCSDSETFEVLRKDATTVEGGVFSEKIELAENEIIDVLDGMGRFIKFGREDHPIGQDAESSTHRVDVIIAVL